MSSQMQEALKKAGVTGSNSKKENKPGKSNPRRSTPQSPMISDVSETFTGTVKFFNLREGYGFITTEDGTDHFVHFTQIARGKRFLGLDSGDVVEFQLNTDSHNREQAIAVRIVEPVAKDDKNAPGEPE